MDEEKPNVPVGHKKQSKEETIVHHAMSMDVEEASTQDNHNHTQEPMATPNPMEQAVDYHDVFVVDLMETSMQDAKEASTQDTEEAGIQDSHNHTQEPMATPNPMEQAVAHHVVAIVDLMEAGTQDATMQEGEEEGFYFPVPDNNDRNIQLHGQRAMRFWPHLDLNATEELGVNQLPRFFEDQEDMTLMDILVQAECNEATTIPLQTRTQAPTNDPINSTSQPLFISANASIMFAGTDEEEDNDWYDSIIRDAQMMEQMEDPGLEGMLSPQDLSRTEVPKEEPRDHNAFAKEDNPKLSLQDISKIWGIHPSKLALDEPSTSTTRQLRVAPLTDDEIVKFDCGICLETLPIFDLFHGMPCHHKFCVRCMGMYIEGKIRVGEVPVPCPDPACMEEGNTSILHPENSKKSIDFAVFCSWSEQLTEHAIPPNLRIYCPNRECGIMLESTCTNKTPSKASCPACNRLMCATCGLDWSTDGSGQHDCGEGPEAVLVKKLATERQWKQCPRCRILVERTMGCDVMTCRCLAVFCYRWRAYATARAGGRRRALSVPQLVCYSPHQRPVSSTGPCSQGRVRSCGPYTNSLYQSQQRRATNVHQESNGFVVASSFALNSRLLRRCHVVGACWTSKFGHLISALLFDGQFGILFLLCLHSSLPPGECDWKKTWSICQVMCA